MMRSTSSASSETSAIWASEARAVTSLVRTGRGNGASPRRCRAVMVVRMFWRTTGLPPEATAAVAAASSLIVSCTISWASSMVVIRSSGSSSMTGMPDIGPSSARRRAVTTARIGELDMRRRMWPMISWDSWSR